MGGWDERFEARFVDLTGRMLRALRNRQLRARERAAALRPGRLRRPLTGSEAAARDRWQRLENGYKQAHDALHGARVHFHYAKVLLHEIEREARERDRGGGGSPAAG